MKSKRILFIIIVIGIILIPMLLYYFDKNEFSQKNIYETNWDIRIPSELKTLYHKQDQHDFQGKGIRYTVFATNEPHSLPLVTFINTTKEIQSFDGNSNTERDYEIEALIQTIVTDLKISESNLPKFDVNYIWQKLVKPGGKLIILYFPYTDRIYFIEDLI